MDISTVNADYKDREYEIVAYDSTWPAEFERYKSTLSRYLDESVRIEHCGSSSVPGMWGKPSIDVMVVVSDIVVPQKLQPMLNAEGFLYSGQLLGEGSCLYRVMEGNQLLANIHFFVTGNPHIESMLAVRDYLRDYPEEVKAYSELKHRLYSAHARDYAAYRAHKDEYVTALQQRALAEYFKSNSH